MINKQDKNIARQRRHLRLRNKVEGSAARPRLNVYRSSSYIYAQIIDDESKVTLVSANSAQADVAKMIQNMTKTESAKVVGKIVGEKALAKGISEVVFDRGGYVYTGRVQALADGARDAGLKF